MRIIDSGLDLAQISELLGIWPPQSASSDDWKLESSAGDSAVSLETQINEIVTPLLGQADKIRELVDRGAKVELFLTRSLLGPGVGHLCFMLDVSVIKFLAEVDASVWFDEYDETSADDRPK
ncbi:DUF4279 domain-containing protein [Herbidospora daliensis]|uniref:DUF4279 domain-containing protein n=1 Tax=Herbidospora daliensis TaxID=295585 RepID=UPI000780905D|nr:DUF4279 domain-containing protein [Herbidospora daliensis]